MSGNWDKKMGKGAQVSEPDPPDPAETSGLYSFLLQCHIKKLRFNLKAYRIKSLNWTELFSDLPKAIWSRLR